MSLKISRLFLTCIAILKLSLAFSSDQENTHNIAASSDPSVQTSELMGLADSSLILDITHAKERAVAVGERGHVLVSESQLDWRQVDNVPTRATLTAVYAVDSDVWAVGHDGVILHSGDSGLTWKIQRVAPYDSESTDAQNGAPLLDVLFLDNHEGFAVGAYALMLHTTDAGETWDTVDIYSMSSHQSSSLEQAKNASTSGSEDSQLFDDEDLFLDEETDPHLNAITVTSNGELFIVAERGVAFRSVDRGARWEAIRLPYEGSMFGVIGFEGKHLLAFGLRGNVYETYDFGDSWKLIPTQTEVSLMGGVALPLGGFILVGGNGVVLSRLSVNEIVTKDVMPDPGVLASVLVLSPQKKYVVTGEHGIMTYEP